jgi:hypothetical protein
MSIGFQHQIRQNAIELQDYLKDLYSWEDKANSGDLKQKPAYTPDTSIPIRGACVQEKTDESLRRDKNTVGNYYSAWEKFDVVSLQGRGTGAN